VNPPRGCVIEQIREFDPSLVGPTGGRALSAEPLRVAQWVVIRLLIAASLAVDATCHPTLSAGADITAVVVYVVFRSLRMRLARRESDDRLVVEGNHYFRLEDVNMEFPDESPTHTVCSWKGEASCYTVLVDEKRNAEAAWYYPHPSPAASRVCRQGRVLAGREGDPLGR
jgi:hypothetical protein